ncbi:Tlc ATP/ADP transporter [Candidatus Fokinia solitaria]|uniref:Tlc ATP/ADP transporter n=1 Tax=Candidatus Fokinia solitaria TaxID=1802984 RepID=A0A2U8BS60_9RICK|nr:hypothetical protein [Candidatus Fokinia solitaria]AWD33138.1 Tlc ATP/ADP transporter [Candidatus Fokinia solitaria]
MKVPIIKRLSSIAGESASTLKNISKKLYVTTRGFNFKHLFVRFFSLNAIEGKKLLLSGFLFAMLIGSYSVVHELQNIVFSALVGVKNVPLAKLTTLGLLFPWIFIDAYLADRVRRISLLKLYICMWIALGLLLLFVVPFDKMNAESLPFLTFREKAASWTFFMFSEGYMVFLVSTFWAFVNSINNPKSSERIYGFIVSCSKIGGMISVYVAHCIMKGFFDQMLGCTTDIQKIKLVITYAITMLFTALITLLIATKLFKRNVFEGYLGTSILSEKISKTGIFLGVRLILHNRYVLGIFGLIFCLELITEFVSFQRIILLVSSSIKLKSTGSINSVSQIASGSYIQILYMHFVGFLLSIFLTNGVMRTLGTAKALLIMPLITAVLLGFYIFNAHFIIYAYVILHALSYSLNTPIRESLYIITSRDIQLKSKFVLDAFAIKGAKAITNIFNYFSSNIATKVGTFLVLLSNDIFISIACALWIFIAYKMGAKYSTSIKDNRIIT